LSKRIAINEDMFRTG